MLLIVVGEMAVGTRIMAWGVQNDLLEMGSQVVATMLGGSKIESLLGAAGGSSIGAIA
jgi:hypothetical protein